MYSFKYNQQDATLYNILYYYQCSTCFRWLVWVSWNSPTLAVAASELDIYQMLCVEF